MVKVIISLMLVSLLTACGSSKSSSANDAKVKESCPLIEEAWSTYLERDLDKTNLDILAASWYLVKQDLEKIAETDAKYEMYVKGVDDALNGDYTSKDLTDLLAFCDISS